MRITVIKLHIIFLILSCFQLSITCAADLADPLGSPNWHEMHEKILNNETVIFDKHVQVNIPQFAEDPANVPVAVRYETLKDVEEIIVFADLNPIQKVLRFQPIDVKPYLSFRIKVEQTTPVRAAVKTADSVWHIGGHWLEAVGGGCSAPSRARGTNDWYEHLLKVSSRLWSHENSTRLRFRIMHPMDTGLASGIPEFYLEELELADKEGHILARINTFQPVSENPVFSIDLNEHVSVPVQLVGSDNNGNQFTEILQ